MDPSTFTTSMEHILEGGLDVVDYLPPRSPNFIPLDFFFRDHLKPFLYETPMSTVENLMAWIVVASVDIASTPDLFECIHRCRPC
ncbi:hypothetical protein TNCV_4426801 [Trichonephila clavipes]|nr:hypothetical protein TNCV_4426801 [Trichonephila clavipes]